MGLKSTQPDPTYFLTMWVDLSLLPGECEYLAPLFETERDGVPVFGGMIASTAFTGEVEGTWFLSVIPHYRLDLPPPRSNQRRGYMAYVTGEEEDPAMQLAHIECFQCDGFDYYAGRVSATLSLLLCPVKDELAIRARAGATYDALLVGLVKPAGESFEELLEEIEVTLGVR